jgi:hypothetical protein
LTKAQARTQAQALAKQTRLDVLGEKGTAPNEVPPETEFYRDNYAIGPED